MVFSFFKKKKEQPPFQRLCGLIKSKRPVFAPELETTGYTSALIMGYASIFANGLGENEFSFVPQAAIDSLIFETCALILGFSMRHDEQNHGGIRQIILDTNALIAATYETSVDHSLPIEKLRLAPMRYFTLKHSPSEKFVQEAIKIIGTSGHNMSLAEELRIVTKAGIFMKTILPDAIPALENLITELNKRN